MGDGLPLNLPLPRVGVEESMSPDGRRLLALQEALQAKGLDWLLVAIVTLAKANRTACNLSGDKAKGERWERAAVHLERARKAISENASI